MNTDTTEETLYYFEKYRQLIKEHNEINENIIIYRDRIENLTKQSKSTYDEVKAMRRIITYMIDNGLDPVEAKLKIDETDKKSHWDEVFLDEQQKIEAIRLMNQMSQTNYTYSYGGGAGGGVGMGVMGATGAIATTVYNPKGMNGGTGRP